MAAVYATFPVAKRKPEKNSGLYGIRTFDLCDTGAAFYPGRALEGCVYIHDDHPSFN